MKFCVLTIVLVNLSLLLTNEVTSKIVQLEVSTA